MRVGASKAREGSLAIGRITTFALASVALFSLLVALHHPPTAALIGHGGMAGTRIIGEGFPKRLIDPLGRAHLLPSPPRRIASVILAGDEMLADLVPTEHVVGVTYLVDDAGISNVAKHYPDDIPRIRTEIEALLALRPDLAVLSTHSDAVGVRMLMASGVAVVRLATFDSFTGVAENLRLLGEILGVPSRAQAVIADIEQRLAVVAEQVAGRPRPRVLYYDLSGSTGGPGTLTDEMIQLAGGHNLIRETGIRGHSRITRELAIALQPDILIHSDWAGSGASSPAEALRNDPAWQAVPAVREGRVYALPGAWVTCGSQYRVAGVEALARLFHPEAFAN